VGTLTFDDPSPTMRDRMAIACDRYVTVAGP
jgi:hypothetical protein